MNQTLDHIQIYVKEVKGTKEVIRNLEKIIKKEKEATLSILDLKTHVNIRSDPSLRKVPLYIYTTIADAMKNGQSYDLLLAIQKSTRPGVAIQRDRGLYRQYQRVHRSLDSRGIPFYCPNPPKDLRKGKRDYSLN